MLVAQGSSTRFVTATLELSACDLLTIAEALTAMGQVSIARDGSALTRTWPFAFEVTEFVPDAFLFLAQQSCECDAAHESVATMVSTELAVDDEACISLLQPKRQPAPAIHAETVIASARRGILLMGSSFIEVKCTLEN